MATQAEFPTNPFDAGDTSRRRNGNGVGKRKRDSLDTGAPMPRDAPNTRKVSAQAQQQANNNFATASIVDMTGDSFHPSANGGHDDSSVHHFDFDMQQPDSKPLQSGRPGQEVGSGTDVLAAAALDQHYNMQMPQQGDDNDIDESGLNMDPTTHYPGLDGSNGNGDGDATLLGKPSVGSEEWHKVRKDNHKEVERRRRETINEGINELAKIVPNCEKNKGSILQRAVQYIAKLQDEASQNIDKWTFEKLVTEQAINDLSAKLSRAWQEKEAFKRLAREAGVDVDNIDLGLVTTSVSFPGPTDAALGKVKTQAADATTTSTTQLMGSSASTASDLTAEDQLDAK